jgi:RNA polymerase sigma-70 factor (ECF subfamily)
MPERQHADETRLIEQAKQGDSGAFGELYEFYAPLVFRFLFAHLDDRQDAEDLTEEIFLRVWEALPGFRQRGAPFGGYLFRVARNALYDYYRRTRRKRGWHVTRDQDWLDETHPDPADSLPARYEQREIYALLGRLSEDYRMVVTLRFLVGLSSEETAEAMSRSPGAVRVLQHRALLSLRQLLDEQENHETERRPSGIPG